jgi:PAS domain S-box-containing protein
MKTNLVTKIQAVAGVSAVATGLFVIASYVFGSTVVSASGTGMAPMTVNVSLCFVFSGLVLLLFSRSSTYLSLSNALSFLVGVIGFATFFEYVSGVSLGIDTFLVRDPELIAVPGGYPGRMAATTSVCFTLLGAAFVAVRSRNRYLLMLAQYALHVITTIAILAIIGYWYNVPSFYRLSFLTSMALNTSVLLFVVSVAASFINPTYGINGLFLGNGMGNIMARKMFPVFVTLMLLLGYLRIESHKHNLVSVEFGIALFVMSFVFLGLFIIRNTARKLNRIGHERERALELLRDAEANYHEIFDKATSAIYVLDIVTGQIIDVNNRATLMTGFSREELLGSQIGWLNLAHSADHSGAKESYFLLAAAGTLQRFEWKSKRKDGSEHWLEVNCEKASIAGCERILAFYYEIDDRKLAQENLQASQERFGAIIEQFPYPVVSYDPGGTYITANRAWELMWEDSRENVVGYNILKDESVMGSPLASVINQAFSGSLAVSEPYLYDPALIGQKGRRRWTVMTLYPLKAADGEIQEVVLILQDVTDRKLAEESLAASERRLRYTLDNMLEGAQIIGFDWRYIYLNDTLEKQGKYRREELLGRTMMEMYPGYEQTNVYAYIKRCLEDRVATHKEVEFKFPDGSVGWFELSIQPIPEGVFILSVEITERKQAEAEVKKLYQNLEAKVAERTAQLTEANKALEAFSYSVSHDLRSPLRVIYGYADMLGEDYDSVFDEEGRRLLGVIQENAKKMGSLIDDLLAFARLGKAEVRKTNVDMKSLVSTVWAEQIRFAPVPVTLSVGDLHTVSADQTLITQVLANLLSNAIKYSAGVASPRVEITSEKVDSIVTFSIGDNGAGFDMQYVDKLFGVFHRLHKSNEYEGTGVGLAIVQNIINKHGGKVWAEGKVGEGAVFYFTLPAGVH